MSNDGSLGRVHVITGPGKGKTTSAFGLAMRAAGHGLRVCIVQFMKTGEITGEVLAAEQLKKVRVAQFGTGRFVGGSGPTDDDRKSAQKAMAHARTQAVGGKCDLLVLDEINVAAFFGLGAVFMGTFISLFLFIVGFMLLWGVRRKGTILITAVGTTALIYIVFTKLLEVQFPAGYLF